MLRQKGMLFFLALSVLMIAVGCGGSNTAPVIGAPGGAQCGGIAAGYTQLPEGAFEGEMNGITQNNLSGVMIGVKQQTNGYPSQAAAATANLSLPDLQFSYPANTNNICLSSNLLNSSTVSAGQVYWDNSVNLRVFSATLRGLLQTTTTQSNYGYGYPGYPTSNQPDYIQAIVNAYLTPANRLSGQVSFTAYGRNPYTGQPAVVYNQTLGIN